MNAKLQSQQGADHEQVTSLLVTAWKGVILSVHTGEPGEGMENISPG